MFGSYRSGPYPAGQTYREIQLAAQREEQEAALADQIARDAANAALVKRQDRIIVQSELGHDDPDSHELGGSD